MDRRNHLFDFAGKPGAGIGFLAFSDFGNSQFHCRQIRCRRNAVCQPRDDRQDDLFGPSPEKIINLGHPLGRLAAEIDRGFLAGGFGSV
jgi:hypothetical protein